MLHYRRHLCHNLYVPVQLKLSNLRGLHGQLPLLCILPLLSHMRFGLQSLCRSWPGTVWRVTFPRCMAADQGGEAHPRRQHSEEHPSA